MKTYFVYYYFILEISFLCKMVCDLGYKHKDSSDIKLIHLKI